MSTVAVIGAGGLGGPIARALAAAGCRLRIADFDRVELSNLQRQVQFTTADVGAPKARVLADLLGATAIDARFDRATAGEIAGDADAIVDGTDSPETKFAVADFALARGLPYVIASALRYGGNVFRGAPGAAQGAAPGDSMTRGGAAQGAAPGDSMTRGGAAQGAAPGDSMTRGGAACYRCLFEAPDDPEGPTCADAGILGPVCACIGGLAARDALRLVAGDHRDAGTILVVDDLRRGLAPRRVSFRPRAGCLCAARRSVAMPA